MREAFYWYAILIMFALGTAAGDQILGILQTNSLDHGVGTVTVQVSPSGATLARPVTVWV